MLIRAQIEAAARQMAPRANVPPRDKLPQNAQRMRAWAFGQIKHWASNANPFEGEELAAMLAVQKEKAHPLADMPLIVLSRGLADADAKAVEDEHARNQAALVNLSRAGKQVIARNSGHEILLSEPELAVTTIRDVLAAAGKR